MLTSNITAIPASRRQNPAFGKVIIDYDSLKHVKAQELNKLDCKSREELENEFLLAEAARAEELNNLKNTGTRTEIKGCKYTGFIGIGSYELDENDNKVKDAGSRTCGKNCKSPLDIIDAAIDNDRQISKTPVLEENLGYKPEPPYENKTELEMAHDFLKLAIIGTIYRSQAKEKFFKKMLTCSIGEKPDELNEHFAARDAVEKIGEALKEYHDRLYPSC